MKWFLIFQVLAYYELVAPQALQFQGPFDTKDQCEQVLDQMKDFHLRAKCVGVQQQQAPK